MGGHPVPDGELEEEIWEASTEWVDGKGRASLRGGDIRSSVVIEKCHTGDKDTYAGLTKPTQNLPHLLSM